MSTIERTELIIYLHCMHLVYFCPHGDMQLNSGSEPLSLHLGELISHQNNYCQKLTILKWVLRLKYCYQHYLKWVMRLKYCLSALFVGSHTCDSCHMYTSFCANSLLLLWYQGLMFWPKHSNTPPT